MRLSTLLWGIHFFVFFLTCRPRAAHSPSDFRAIFAWRTSLPGKMKIEVGLFLVSETGDLIRGTTSRGVSTTPGFRYLAEGGASIPNQVCSPADSACRVGLETVVGDPAPGDRLLVRKRVTTQMNRDGDQRPAGGRQRPRILSQIGDGRRVKCGREWHDMRGCEDNPWHFLAYAAYFDDCRGVQCDRAMFMARSRCGLMRSGPSYS